MIEVQGNAFLTESRRKALKERLKTLKPINLSNLKDSTDQEVFDWITINLLLQNAQSRLIVNLFRYRDSFGRKCAAGWLMSDDEYKPEFEGKSWDTLVELGNVPPAHRNMIKALQDVHNNVLPETWVEEFKEVADEFSLRNNG